MVIPHSNSLKRVGKLISFMLATNIVPTKCWNIFSHICLGAILGTCVTCFSEGEKNQKINIKQVCATDHMKKNGPKNYFMEMQKQKICKR